MESTLRGVANNADDIIQRFNPDVIFIPHGAEIVSRILARMAAYRRIIPLLGKPIFVGIILLTRARRIFSEGLPFRQDLEGKAEAKFDTPWAGTKRAEDFIRVAARYRVIEIRTGLRSQRG